MTKMFLILDLLFMYKFSRLITIKMILEEGAGLIQTSPQLLIPAQSATFQTQK